MSEMRTPCSECEHEMLLREHRPSPVAQWGAELTRGSVPESRAKERTKSPELGDIRLCLDSSEAVAIPRPPMALTLWREDSHRSTSEANPYFFNLL